MFFKNQLLFSFFLLLLKPLSILAFESDSLKITKPKLHFELAQNVGKTIANHPRFPYTNISTVTEFSFLRQCIGTEKWHQSYGFPEVGSTFLFGSFGNQSVLGNCFAAFPTISFEPPVEKKISFQKKFGLGLAFFDRPYNKQTDSTNIAIGSHVTAVANLALTAKFKLANNVFASAGISYFHFSNAHYQLPNLGLNATLARVGIIYYPHQKQTNFYRVNAISYDEKFHLNIKLGIGINERGKTLGPIGGAKYVLYLASVFATKNYSPAGKFQIGLEGNYNNGSRNLIRDKNIYSIQRDLRSTTALFFLGNEFVWNHLSFVVQGGLYLYNPLFRELLSRQRHITTKEHLKSWFTAKMGLQYYVFNVQKTNRNQIYFGAYVKTNLGQADYLDLGVGYSF